MRLGLILAVAIVAGGIEPVHAQGFAIPEIRGFQAREAGKNDGDYQRGLDALPAQVLPRLQSLKQFQEPLADLLIGKAGSQQHLQRLPVHSPILALLPDGLSAMEPADRSYRSRSANGESSRLTLESAACPGVLSGDQRGAKMAASIDCAGKCLTN